MATQHVPDRGRGPFEHNDFKAIIREECLSPPKNLFPVPLNVHLYHDDWMGYPVDQSIQALLTDRANIFLPGASNSVSSIPLLAAVERPVALLRARAARGRLLNPDLSHHVTGLPQSVRFADNCSQAYLVPDRSPVSLSRAVF